MAYHPECGESITAGIALARGWVLAARRDEADAVALVLEAGEVAPAAVLALVLGGRQRWGVDHDDVPGGTAVDREGRCLRATWILRRVTSSLSTDRPGVGYPHEKKRSMRDIDADHGPVVRDRETATGPEKTPAAPMRASAWIAAGRLTGRVSSVSQGPAGLLPDRTESWRRARRGAEMRGRNAIARRQQTALATTSR